MAIARVLLVDDGAGVIEVSAFRRSCASTMLVLCFVIVALLTARVPSLCEAAEPVAQGGESFREIFERYRSADADDAVDEFSRWDAERVEREARLPPDVRDLKSLAAFALLAHGSRVEERDVRSSRRDGYIGAARSAAAAGGVAKARVAAGRRREAEGLPARPSDVCDQAGGESGGLRRLLANGAFVDKRDCP